LRSWKTAGNILLLSYRLFYSIWKLFKQGDMRLYSRLETIDACCESLFQLLQVLFKPDLL